MNTRKCPACGAEMELSRANRCLICEYCGTHVDVEIEDDGNSGLFDEKMFDFLWNLESLKQFPKCKESLESMQYCLNELKTSESVAKYIRTTLISSSDVATEGVNQNRIDKVMPKISGMMEPGEHIIFYGDEGIFSRGKEFCVITEKKSIFVNGKNSVFILHSDISAMRMKPNGGYPRWIINNREPAYFSGLANKYRLQGAIAALLCLYAWETQSKKEKIKLL